MSVSVGIITAQMLQDAHLTDIGVQGKQSTPSGAVDYEIYLNALSTQRGSKQQSAGASNLYDSAHQGSVRRDLRYSGILDAELFAQQGTRFVEPIVFRREWHPCIDTIGRPGTRVNDGVVGQCDCMEYRRLNAVLPALGKMNTRWLWVGKHRDLRKRVLESFRLKDTIRAIVSKC